MALVKIAEKTDDPVVNLALDTLNKKKQALVFVNSKKSAEKQAEDIAKSLKEAHPAGADCSKMVLSALSTPTKQCKRLSQCLVKGIAFHHAGLHPKQRRIIEEAFRNGGIHIICATPTLAAGLDLPAFRVILRDTKRYMERRGMAPIPVLEYLQMIGRGGRPKFDSYGEGICVAKTQENKDEIYNNYIHGEPEDIQSKLAVEPVLRTYLLSLISSDVISSKREILDFFKETFWAFQYKSMDELTVKIEQMLGLLSEWGFLECSQHQEFCDADNIDRAAYKPTKLGKRVSELYLDPLTAFEFITALQEVSRIESTNPISFLQIISSALEMRPSLKIRAKEFDHYQDRAAFYSPYLAVKEPKIYDYEFEGFLSNLKTAMLLESWMGETDEETLTETYTTSTGELHAKFEIAGWLLYALGEFAKLSGLAKLAPRIDQLKTRLKYGVREELLPLVRFKNIGRVRARILYKNNIKDIKGIRCADLNTLSQLVGQSLALKLKEEIGEVIEHPIKFKSHGQTSLTKKWHTKRISESKLAER